jgi:hypothetical protein
MQIPLRREPFDWNTMYRGKLFATRIDTPRPTGDNLVDIVQPELVNYPCRDKSHVIEIS